MKSARVGGRVFSLAALLTLLVGCEPPPIRIVRHVPPGALSLPPLAEPVAFQASVAGDSAEDSYAWLVRGDRAAMTWMDQQLDFSRALLSAIPAPPRNRERYLELGAAPWRITELRGTADIVFYVLPDGVGGATAPAHLMIASGGGAPGEVFGVEQPVAVRPSPDGKTFALGRAGAAPTRTVVVFDREKVSRLETLQHATAGSVAWTRDSKSFYYVGYPGGDLPAVLRHVVGDGADKDRPVFGAAAFGRNQIGKGDELAVSVGNKAITVSLRSRASGRLTPTVFTTSLAAVESTDPAWRDITPPLGFDTSTSHGDSLFLWPGAGAKSQGMKRVDLTQAAPPEAFGAPGARVVAAAEAEDGVYVIRDGRVARLALPNGDKEETLDVPGDVRAVALEASPFVPGARAFFSSCTGGGWFSYRAGDRAAHKLALDPRVAEPTSLETRTLSAKNGDGAVEVTVLARRGAAARAERPTVLFPHGCGTFSPELGPWLDGGGVAAFCDVHPLRNATTPLAVVEGRRRQAAELRACAHALVAEKIATPATIGIRASGEAGLVVLSALVDEPQLVKAVAIGQGLFDARRPGREVLPEYQVRDPSHQAIVSSVPYLRVGHALPPFVLVLSPDKDDAAANWQSLKLAARLEALRPDGLAALVIMPKDPDDGRHGPGGTVGVSADVDAFMRIMLDPRAAGDAPVVLRADASYAATHAGTESPSPP